ncbi:hypothetical protein MMC34_006118 [Xylographa carneopallida]|nr:hypothetical protein [Xylographa carneopallida]
MDPCLETSYITQALGTTRKKRHYRKKSNPHPPESQTQTVKASPIPVEGPSKGKRQSDLFVTRSMIPSENCTAILSLEARNAKRTLASEVKCKTKLQNRFYEELALLRALDLIRGAHRQRFLVGGSDSPEEIRRDFIDAIAYACDYEKGGDTVTAALLERRCDRIVIWLASNKGVKRGTEHKLDDLLRAAISDLSHNRGSPPEICLRKMVHMNVPRIRTYVKFANKDINKCIEILRKSLAASCLQQQDVQSTIQWLEIFRRQLDGDLDYLAIAKECFKARDLEVFRILDQYAKGDDRHFTPLRHHIGRLGSHVKATNAIYKGLRHFPRISEKFEIQSLPASSESPFPLALSEKRVKGIAGRMFGADQQVQANECHEKLQSIGRNIEGGLAKYLRNICPKETYVHAELQLLDFARRENVDFVDDDKYIGCSKPACYSCYEYVQALQEDYHVTAPSTHNKVYLSWRVPDVRACDGPAADESRTKVMNTMTRAFRANLVRQINQRCGRPHQFDTTTGVTALPATYVPLDNATARRDARSFGSQSAHASDMDTVDETSHSASASDTESVSGNPPRKYLSQLSLIPPLVPNEDSHPFRDSEDDDDTDGGGIGL